MENLSVEVLDHHVPVALAFTSNYFVPAAVCIQSIINSSKIDERFHIICLVSYEMTDSQKEKLYEFANTTDRIHIDILNMKSYLQNIYINEKYTVAASYRLLLPDLLPNHDKLIYMDCDMIVRRSFASMYYTLDLKDNYFAAVEETIDAYKFADFQRIGFEGDQYFNSGFLYMNLRKLREDNMVEELLEASKETIYKWPDQDILNIHCKDHILKLPPYYNGYWLGWDSLNCFLDKYSKYDWGALVNYGIIHYAVYKPWKCHYNLIDRYWWKCYEMLPDYLKNEWEKTITINYLYTYYKLGKITILRYMGHFMIWTVRKFNIRYKKLLKHDFETDNN